QSGCDSRRESRMRTRTRKIQDNSTRPGAATKSGPQKTRAPRKLLLLAVLAVASFGATYALVKFSRQGEKPQTDGPPGMVWVPGGEFTMGTDADLGWPDEKPAHRVRVSGFWIDQTEVTNAQFRAFVEATGYVT